MYLSPEQTKALSGNNSQGPVYKAYGSIGPQPDSRYASQPAPGFGTSARTYKDTRASFPGPGELLFCAQRPVGQHRVGRQQRAITPFVFGGAAVAGTYVQEGSIGPMVESKRETLPRPVFGTATRDTQSKVWLDEELMKTYAGRGSPGPCTYKTPGGLGKQPDSKYSSEPAWKQGTSERFRCPAWFPARRLELTDCSAAVLFAH